MFVCIQDCFAGAASAFEGGRPLEMVPLPKSFTAGGRPMTPRDQQRPRSPAPTLLTNAPSQPPAAAGGGRPGAGRDKRPSSGFGADLVSGMGGRKVTGGMQQQRPPSDVAQHPPPPSSGYITSSQQRQGVNSSRREMGPRPTAPSAGYDPYGQAVAVAGGYGNSGAKRGSSGGGGMPPPPQYPPAQQQPYNYYSNAVEM